ncbi:MAG TPA: hypothetical protein VJ507_04040 [Candidatus Bathyarchaeia archaeon]|nr:hypothetical protein [Candidatus Bathyarchaeia archaeon]
MTLAAEIDKITAQLASSYLTKETFALEWCASYLKPQRSFGADKGA